MEDALPTEALSLSMKAGGSEEDVAEEEDVSMVAGAAAASAMSCRDMLLFYFYALFIIAAYTGWLGGMVGAGVDGSRRLWKMNRLAVAGGYGHLLFIY